jgi:hypothetical protein
VKEPVSGRLPPYAEEVAPIVRELLRALQAQDEAGIAPLLIEGSESDWGFRLFGMGPLIFLLYMHLERDEFVLPRFARRGRREVLVEVGWVTGTDEQGRSIYDPRRLSTVTIQRRGEQGGISDVTPSPLDHPLTVSEAQDVLRRAVEEGKGGNPLWFPLGVLTGAFQLKRLGKEPLDEVEELLVKGMERSSFGVPEIIRAVRLWRDFKGGAAAGSHRPQVYAAAVEYIMVLFGFYGDSQVAIGQRYEVSAASISATWREIEAALGLSQFDSRYSVHADPGAPLEAMLRQRGEEPPPPVPLGIGRGARTYDLRARW